MGGVMSSGGAQACPFAELSFPYAAWIMEYFTCVGGNKAAIVTGWVVRIYEVVDF